MSNETSKKQYVGEVMSFRYKMTFNSDAEFEEWLESDLRKYKFQPIELKVLKRIFGMDKLLDRISALEEKIK